MLSAVHATDVIYMLVYLSCVAGTSGAVCAHSSNLTLSSPQGMCHAQPGSAVPCRGCLHAYNLMLVLSHKVLSWYGWIDRQQNTLISGILQTVYKLHS